MSSPTGPSHLVSPDGRWRWDGVRWVPLPAAPAAALPMPARWVALTVVGSIASLLLAGTGLAALTDAYGGASARIFGGGAPANCLPSDFPRYPGSVMVLSFKSFNLCTAAFTSDDTRDSVLAYYQLELARSPWRETGADQDTIDFARLDGRRGSGELSVTQGRNATQFQVVYQT
jgi:hypothetical protein